MFRSAVVLALLALLGTWCAAQVAPAGSGQGKAPESQAPPRSDLPGTRGESSSKDYPDDVGPGLADSDATGVNEFKKYDPHRADKDIEVGDYYASQGNYRGALLRYHDALDYKPNDPTAIFRLATTYEKVKQPKPAARYLVLYLRLAPQGEYAEEAKQMQERLRPAIQAQAGTPEKKRAFALVDEGAQLLGAHDFRGAIARFREALEADPENEDASFFLADALEKNGLMEEAGAAYRFYLRLDPHGVFADAARIALEHLPQLRGEGIPAKPELPTSLPSESPR
jgi:tetratricopeptide (TPR) repeat protein